MGYKEQKEKTDRPKGRKEEENKMKFNKVQAMDINQLDMVAGGRATPGVKDKFFKDVKETCSKVKNLFKKLFD